MSHLDRVSETFDRWAEEGRADGMEAGHRATASRALEELLPLGGTRFLDLGTGNGWAAREAARRGARAVGVDVAPRMLQRARGAGEPQSPEGSRSARGSASGGAVEVARASFHRLPLRSGVLDVVFSMEALYYARDLDAALREAHRVLHEDGRLVLVVDYYGENEASAGWPELTGLPMHRLDAAEWATRLEDAGFRGVRADRLRARGDDVEAWKVEHGSLRLRGRARGSEL